MALPTKSPDGLQPEFANGIFARGVKKIQAAIDTMDMGSYAFTDFLRADKLLREGIEDANAGLLGLNECGYKPDYDTEIAAFQAGILDQATTRYPLNESHALDQVISLFPAFQPADPMRLIGEVPFTSPAVPSSKDRAKKSR